MGHIRNIQELKDRQDSIDQMHIDHAAEVSLMHPNHAALDRRPLKLLNPITNLFCADCEEPEFQVRDKVAGTEGPRCRGCINATVRLSLEHTNMVKKMCIRCEITTDSYGIVNGANHIEVRHIEDFAFKGGVAPGLKRLIDLNLMEIDDDTDMTMIHTSAHRPNEHCVGCKFVRHPGCPGVGICGKIAAA